MADLDEGDDGPENSVQLVGRTDGRALPLAMLERALGKHLARFLPKDPLCVVVRVKEADWVPPIASAARLGTWGAIVSSDLQPRDRERQALDALVTLARGKRVLCISTKEALPTMRLSRAADLVVDIDRIEVADVRKAIHATTGARPRGLIDADLTGVELPQAISAIRFGSTAASCVRRLRASVTKLELDPFVEAAPLLGQLHGYGEAQAWGERLVADLDRWRAGEIEFQAIQRNMVLAGPPGTGKSTFMRSLARSARLPLLTSSVGQMFATSAGYLDSIVKAIDILFASARNAGPSAIVFIDELEAFPSRSSLSGRDGSWWTPVVNHMLTTVDGALSTSASQLIVVGATNHPDRIDPALLRPGRMDRIIWIDPPDEVALEGIYRQHLGSDLADEDMKGIAAIAIGSTGADVAAHVKGARAKARREGRTLSLQDLVDELAPPSDLSEEDRWRACVHEAGHAFVASFLGTGEVVSIAVLGGGEGGRVVSKRHGSTIASAESNRRLAMQMLAGRAAEEILLGSVSGGAGGGGDSDLARASNLVAAAHLSYGLRGRLTYGADPADALAVAGRSAAMLLTIEAEMGETYAATLEVVRSSAGPIRALAECVMEERVISGGRMLQILSQHCDPGKEL